MSPLLLSLGLWACAGGSGDDTAGIDCTTDDADGDGLDGCAEAQLGTDPELADSDGDGLTDGEEVECVSNPLDADEICYSCGWPHSDPGTLEATGSDSGDTIENLPLWDQCEEETHLWDFAEEYHILFLTAEW